MVTIVTPESVSRVESLTKKDPKMTHAEMQDIMKFNREVSLAFSTTALAVRKRCARCVPQNLSEEQKRGRVHWCTHMLRKFDGGRSPRVWGFVLEDKSWVYQYDP